jgi:hypothetical protein
VSQDFALIHFGLRVQLLSYGRGSGAATVSKRFLNLKVEKAPHHLDHPSVYHRLPDSPQNDFVCDNSHLLIPIQEKFIYNG